MQMMVCDALGGGGRVRPSRRCNVSTAGDCSLHSLGDADARHVKEEGWLGVRWWQSSETSSGGEEHHGRGGLRQSRDGQPWPE